MKFLALLPLTIFVTSCLESQEPSFVPIRETTIEKQVEEKEPRILTGDLALEELTLPISPQQEELTITLEPAFLLRPVWHHLGHKIVKDVLRRPLCEAEFFQFKEFERVPFLTENIKRRHVDIYLGDQLIDYNHNAEWLEDLNHITIIIQNHDGEKTVKMVNRSIIEHRQEWALPANDCPEDAKAYPHEQPAHLEKVQYHRFHYQIQ